MTQLDENLYSTMQQDNHMQSNKSECFLSTMFETTLNKLSLTRSFAIGFDFFDYFCFSSKNAGQLHMHSNIFKPIHQAIRTRTKPLT